MEDKRVQRMLLRIMAGLNLLIVLFLSLTIGLTAERIARTGQARAFFDQIAAMPDSPRFAPVAAIALYVLMLAAMGLAQREKQLRVRRLLAAAAIALCVMLMVILRMGYAGVVLLLAAEFMLFFDSRGAQMTFIGTMTVLYLLSDYDLISSQFPLVSFQEYLFYYNTTTANFLLSMKNVLTSINMVLFIVIIVQISLQRTEEHKKVVRLNRELGEANKRIMEYAIESERSAETRERNRLAREIHDTMGHTLTGISAGLDACLTLIDRSPELAKQQLQVLADVSRSGLRDVRRSVHALGPDALEGATLSEAIRKLVDDTASATGAAITLDSVLDEVQLQRDEEDTVYRIVQEGMTNAIKHGHATEIVVKIKLEGRWLVVIVSDNGTGCADFEKGFGLKHMEERVALLGGRLQVKSFHGFTIVARLNIRWKDE